MMKPKSLFLTIVMLTAAYNSHARPADVCNAINTIVRDAPNKFRNIRGAAQQSGLHVSSWACGIQVPGTIASRFVSSMGLFYEGAFFQTTDISEVRAVYEEHKKELTDCLLAQGYKLTMQDNFYPGMKDYKKLVFMPDDAKAKTPPPHITMEAAYNKTVGKYTVVMYIFEH